MIIFEPFFWWIFKKIWEKLQGTPTSKTVHIAILGDKAAGKTTLWNMLKYGESKESKPTSQSLIESFNFLTKSDNNIKVSETIDIGGGNEWVTLYENILNSDGTFVYYLVDINRIKELKLSTRARLQKIYNISKNKKDCGIKIIATHLDEYLKKDINNTKVSAVEHVKRTLNLETIHNVKIDSSKIIAMDLLNKNDVDFIKDEIGNI